jgi:hypothetical protein
MGDFSIAMTSIGCSNQLASLQRAGNPCRNIDYRTNLGGIGMHQITLIMTTHTLNNQPRPRRHDERGSGMSRRGRPSPNMPRGQRVGDVQRVFIPPLTGGPTDMRRRLYLACPDCCTELASDYCLSSTCRSVAVSIVNWLV